MCWRSHQHSISRPQRVASRRRRRLLLHRRQQRRSTLPRTAGRPFVGRYDELSLLLDAATKVRAGLGGRAVVVSGEPGIGKTRVVEEAVAEMADLTVAWSRCPESTGAAAYWAVAQVGRQLDGAGVLDEEMLTAMLPDEGRTDLDGGAASDRLSLHLEIVRLLRAAARPLVIVLDDLQWADPASLRVIEFVAGELQRLPILLVVTVRPVNADSAGTSHRLPR